jgi:hypothetical protein
MMLKGLITRNRKKRSEGEEDTQGVQGGDRVLNQKPVRRLGEPMSELLAARTAP